MDSPALTVMVVQLIAALHGLTGHAVPAAVPAVELVPQATLAQMACGQPCGVQGWYGGKMVVYLDDRLDPQDNLWDRGILAHELVHYMQEQDGAFGTTPTCERWLEREREAYDAQRDWLLANRPPDARPGFGHFAPLHLRCDD